MLSCTVIAEMNFTLLNSESFMLTATEYHSEADYNPRRVGVVVVVVVVVTDFKKWITFCPRRSVYVEDYNIALIV